MFHESKTAYEYMYYLFICHRHKIIANHHHRQIHYSCSQYENRSTLVSVQCSTINFINFYFVCLFSIFILRVASRPLSHCVCVCVCARWYCTTNCGLSVITFKKLLSIQLWRIWKCLEIVRIQRIIIRLSSFDIRCTHVI